MESVNSFWMVVVIVFGIGAVIGAVVYRLFNPSGKNTAKLQERLEQVEEELTTYKASVNSHFSKTSDLVSELTQGYVKVYKHLAEGAQKLGDPKGYTNVLEQQQGKVLISFADEVVPETEDATELTAADDSQSSEAKAAAEDKGDESLTPESQEHLTETIKEAAEKMKGAESPVIEDAVTKAEPKVEEYAGKTEHRSSAGKNDTAEAMVAPDSDSPPEPHLEVRSATDTATDQAQPEQENSKQ